MQLQPPEINTVIIKTTFLTTVGRRVYFYDLYPSSIELMSYLLNKTQVTISVLKTLVFYL